MSLIKAAARGFVIVLLSVQVIQGGNDWGVTYTSTNICALEGSTVNLHCSYKYPSTQNGRTEVQETFWVRNVPGYESVELRKDSEYSGRVQETCSQSDCTLTITDLRESDAAQYKFRFITNQPGGRDVGSPGVTLSVTDLQVKVELVKKDNSNQPEMKCHSRCPLSGSPSYVWYENGEKIHSETSSSYSGATGYRDSYSCAVRGQEQFSSPSVCIYDQYCDKVTYTSRSICAVKGSSVDISCSYKSYSFITSKQWFSPQRGQQWSSPSQPDSQHRVQVFDTEGDSTLRISDLTESDSAEYLFRFTAGSFTWRSSLPGTTLTVTDLQVQVTRISVSGSLTEAELKCHSSCRPAGRLSYVWFKNDEQIKGEQGSSYKGWFHHEDVISCALGGDGKYRSPSVYAPKLPSVSLSPAAEIEEGRSVTLTCSSDANPAANYTWYKDNEHLHPPSKEPQLVFSSIKPSDSGKYKCRAENELGERTSESISVLVTYAPKLPSVSVSPSATEIVEGSSVTLTCSSDANPAASYTWYKNNQTLPHGQGSIYNFPSVSSEDSGYYHCKSENQHGGIISTSVHIAVQYAPKLPSVSVSPSAEMEEGSSVTLTCSSDANPAANYTWYKENEDSPKASGQNFTITDLRAEHSGNYYCEVQNIRGRHNNTLHLTVVAGSMKYVTAGFVTIFLLLTFLTAFLLIRRKRPLKQTTEHPESNAQLNVSSACDNPSNAAQRKPADEQDDVYYASIRFNKKQEDPIYSNVELTRPGVDWNGAKEEEDSVEYTEVKFVNSDTALYSTVTK